MRGVALDGAALLQKHFAEMSDSVGQNVGLVLFRHERKNHIRENFLGYPRGKKIGRIRRVSVFSMCFCTISLISQCRQSDMKTLALSQAASG